jgi:magnesium transporter
MFPSPPPSSSQSTFSAHDLRDAWAALSWAERMQGFQLLSRVDAEDVFLNLVAYDQAGLILHLPAEERRMWIRLLPPDDAADVLQGVPPADRDGLLALLDEPTRKEVNALLAHAEDEAGGLMNPRFARVRPEMTVDEAIGYIRKQARERVATIYYVYVLDPEQHLLGALSFRELFAAPAEKTVSEIMRTNVARLSETTDQREVASLFARHDLLAMPVVDTHGHMVGIVTVDDVVDVVQEAATEDMQKMGGGEALGAPYLSIGFLSMVKKRAGWLSALFLGEMLTATAMGHFEDEIAKAVVLALFVPLIISSGGNSGSQATTLVIRAMALGEVRLRDWWRIAYRELRAGLLLGAVLGTIGMIRIFAWQTLFHTYGQHWSVIAATVGISLVGVVSFGTLAGSMLPFVLRKLGFDPASASAPFVATLVDVTGLVIYFTVASVVMGGKML